ncbi:MAG TPA: hypothetical protein PKD54_16360, partial [Pirellulaceae bacterium]|nr:hypothetical protein [Pirellulaceae bacterium]
MKSRAWLTAALTSSVSESQREFAPVTNASAGGPVGTFAKTAPKVLDATPPERTDNFPDVHNMPFETEKRAPAGCDPSINRLAPDETKALFWFWICRPRMRSTVL